MIIMPCMQLHVVNIMTNLDTICEYIIFHSRKNKLVQI